MFWKVNVMFHMDIFCGCYVSYGSVFCKCYISYGSKCSRYNIAQPINSYVVQLGDMVMESSQFLWKKEKQNMIFLFFPIHLVGEFLRAVLCNCYRQCTNILSFKTSHKLV